MEFERYLAAVICEAIILVAAATGCATTRPEANAISAATQQPVAVPIAAAYATVADQYPVSGAAPPPAVGTGLPSQYFAPLPLRPPPTGQYSASQLGALAGPSMPPFTLGASSRACGFG